jgi:ADP-heptose:LPS heptosyltransferase
LARCIGQLGEVHLEDSANWDLHLNESEEKSAEELLSPQMPAFIAASVGTKIGVKDWGEDNWSSLLGRVSDRYPGLGLVLLGSADEQFRSEFVSAKWNGPKKNLCGVASPRVSAAVLKRALLFVGHDSGPMHLAAASGVPCVAIFSARNKPGVWFPFGSKHAVIYHRVECYGCRLERCIDYEKQCIASITVQEVFDAVCGQLAERTLVLEASLKTQKAQSP